MNRPVSSLIFTPALGLGGGGGSGSPPGDPSTLLSFDQPIAGPGVTFSYDTALRYPYYYTDSVDRNTTTSTGKEYVEYKHTGVSIPTEAYNFYMGWCDDAETDHIDAHICVGIEKNSFTANYRVNLNGSVYGFDQINAGIAAGHELAVDDVLGLAIDWDASKLYVHLNGTWVTSDGGSLGGEPGVGAGYDITGTSNNLRFAFACRTLVTDAGSNFAGTLVSPSYLPAGYTALT